MMLLLMIPSQNDTCNEDLTPGCQSHDLAKGCEAMLEGRWRKERGLQYAAFVAAFYGAICGLPDEHGRSPCCHVSRPKPCPHRGLTRDTPSV